MKQNTNRFKWIALCLLLLAFLYGGEATLNAQTNVKNRTDDYRTIVAWIYDYGQATPIKIKVKDGEVVAYQLSNDKEDPRKQEDSWINIIPSATVVKTSGYEDGNLARKHEYKAKLRVGDGFRNNYILVYL